MVFVGNTAISDVPNKGDGAVFFHLSSIVGNTLSVYGIVSIPLIDPDFTASACKLPSTSMRYNSALPNCCYIFATIFSSSKFISQLM